MSAPHTSKLIEGDYIDLMSITEDRKYERCPANKAKMGVNFSKTPLFNIVKALNATDV